jgi:hypothetical protein
LSFSAFPANCAYLSIPIVDFVAMQLDRTRIAIRERGLLETLDLTLLVLREFAGPIFFYGLLAILPLALINYALVGWMAPADYEDGPLGFRYLWNMSLLIYLEAPLASVFIVAFLGPAVVFRGAIGAADCG